MAPRAAPRIAARRLNVLFHAEVQASVLDITVPFERDMKL